MAIYAAISLGISYLVKASVPTIGMEDLIYILLGEQIVSLALILWVYRIQSKRATLKTYRYRLTSLGFKNLLLILASTYFMLNTTGLIAFVYAVSVALCSSPAMA